MNAMAKQGFELRALTNLTFKLQVQHHTGSFSLSLSHTHISSILLIYYYPLYSEVSPIFPQWGLLPGYRIAALFIHTS